MDMKNIELITKLYKIYEELKAIALFMQENNFNSQDVDIVIESFNTTKTLIDRLCKNNIKQVEIVEKFTVFKTFTQSYDPRDIWVDCTNCGYSTTTRFAKDYTYCPKCGLKIKEVQYYD